LSGCVSKCMKLHNKDLKKVLLSKPEWKSASVLDGSAIFPKAFGIDSIHASAYKTEILDCSTLRTIGGFSSGTFKDYRSARLVNDFGPRAPVLYSIVYTTAGYSLGNIAREYNELNSLSRNERIIPVSVIDEGLNPRIKEVLRACSEIVELPLSERIISREEVLDAVKAKIGSKSREYVAAENYDFAYSEMARQIHFPDHADSDFNKLPNAIFVPLGGGEALNSILEYHIREYPNDFNNFSKRKFSNFTDAYVELMYRWPSIFAATIRANVFAGKTSPGDCSIAEKLVTPHSELLQKINSVSVIDPLIFPKKGAVQIIVVEEDEIMPAYKALQKAGIKAEPSAAVAFAALNHAILSDGVKVCIVNSGSGIYVDESGKLRGV